MTDFWGEGGEALFLLCFFGPHKPVPVGLLEVQIGTAFLCVGMSNLDLWLHIG